MNNVNQKNQIVLTALVRKLNLMEGSEARKVYESLPDAFFRSADADDERLDRTGREMAEAIIANNLDAFCTAVCGRSLSSLLDAYGIMSEIEQRSAITSSKVAHAEAALASCKKIHEGISELCSIVDIINDDFGETNRLETYKSMSRNVSAWEDFYSKFLVEAKKETN